MGQGKSTPIERGRNGDDRRREASPQTLADGRLLATVLFTDIVDSTRMQLALGDDSWKRLLEQHHAVVRMHLREHGGIEQDTAGDGFYTVFYDPSEAIRCVRAILADLDSLGIEIRAGVHSGDCVVADGKCSGLAVSIGARVMAMAGPSEILVSETTKDLLAEAAITLVDIGLHDLKGIPDQRRLYRVEG